MERSDTNDDNEAAGAGILSSADGNNRTEQGCAAAHGYGCAVRAGGEREGVWGASADNGAAAGIGLRAGGGQSAVEGGGVGGLDADTVYFGGCRRHRRGGAGVGGESAPAGYRFCRRGAGVAAADFGARTEPGGSGKADREKSVGGDEQAAPAQVR